MKSFLWVFVLVMFSVFDGAFCKESTSLVEVKSVPVTYLKVDFNLVDYFTGDELESEAQVKYKEMEEKNFFVTGTEHRAHKNINVDYPPDKQIESGTFIFWWCRDCLFLIDKAKPNQCVRLDYEGTNEIGSIDVEKLNDRTNRIFVESVGNGSGAYTPRTEIWDYDSAQPRLTKYLTNTGYCCASDIENKGTRDLIPYMLELDKPPKPIGILSWNGKKWEDITQSKMDLLKKFNCSECRLVN